MKKLSTLILAGLLLTACGGGGANPVASAPKLDVKVGGKDSTLNVKSGAVNYGNVISTAPGKPNIQTFAHTIYIANYEMDTTTPGQPAKFETRCGWYDNPTPGNHWLSDKEDEWIIGVQGGYQLEDFVAPVFKKTQWVSFFGRSYGYGCACFRMRVDKQTKYVLEIKSSYARPLLVCRKDKALRKWKIEEN